MNRPRLLAISVLVVSLALAADKAWTQQRANSNYHPTAPIFSPWLNLYQRNPGPLGSYQSNVRPQVELQNQLQRQNARIEQQGAGISSLRTQVGDLEKEETIAHPTGTGSVFMDYSHYFDTRSTGARLRSSSRPVGASASRGF